MRMTAIAILLLFAYSAGDEQSWDFEDTKAGDLPAGWTAAKTGDGPGSEWRIIVDEIATSGEKVAAQVSSEGPNPLYNLCLAEDTSFGDVELSVQVRAVSGKLDQGGGVLWRAKDAKNYYIARWNPLETNFRVYKVVDGKREQLDTADVQTDPVAWHQVRIVQRGDQIECWLDDERLLEATDGQLTEPGQIGLWCKADAVTHFDDLQVRPLKND